MNDTLTRSLRALDPASPTLTPAQERRAEETLERTLATPSDARRVARPVAVARATSWRRRVVLTAAGTTAVASVLFVAAGGPDPDYSTWTAVPAAASAQDVERAATVCRGKLAGGSLDLDRAQLVLSERRGDLIALLYRTDDPDVSGSCLVHQPPGSEDIGHVSAGAGGSSGPTLPVPPEGFTQGAIHAASVDGAAGASITDGAVGDEVAAVTIRAGEFTVEATIANGRYTAWWPGPAFRESDDGGPPTVMLTYDLTLSDGTVIRDAQPTVPS